MILAVSGSRIGMTPWQRRAMVRLIQHVAVTAIVHGDCIGVDAEADEIARGLGIDRFAFPSTHKSRAYCDGVVYLDTPAPPMKRNRRIVEHGAYLVACPRDGSVGTWQAVRHARYIGRPMMILGDAEVLERVEAKKETP